MTNPMKRAAIIGWPVEHSRSPLIHGYWLEKHKIEGSYDRIALAPEDVDRFFSSFMESGFCGANVTIPHKQAVISHLGEIDDAAKDIGAVNTIWVEDGLLKGANTDWLGFVGNLDSNAPGWDMKNDAALVLGAGGAARGVIYGLLARGFKKIIVANRTFAKALELRKIFGNTIRPVEFKDAQPFVDECNLIVNTTSLGMEGQEPLNLSFVNLQSQCLVTDIVYSPLQTPLLKRAEERGNQTVDGLGMLLHQAVPGFERWFGVLPEVTSKLRSLVVEDLGLGA